MRGRGPSSGIWHLDETFVKVAGRQTYLWRAVDSEGEVLDMLVLSRQSRRPHGRMHAASPAWSLSMLAACAADARLSTPYPGVEAQIRSYYEQRALERTATCVTPYIADIVTVEPAQETAEQIALDVTYLYDVRVRTAEYGLAACRNFAERRFTFARTEGGLRLTGMTGEQRG